VLREWITPRSRKLLSADKPFVSLAVALRSMLADTEAKVATAAIRIGVTVVRSRGYRGAE
jgi:hypothetical protein